MASKNIIMCFDGTCNHPRDARQERQWLGMGDIEDRGITNVLKLHVLLGGNLKNEPLDGKQHSFYYSGIGTYGNKVQQMFNAAFSPENMDVGRIIKAAGKDLRKTYKDGDKIFVFGFSRGAALARRFACVIDDYLPRDIKPAGIVRFVGVFDTVASIGVPNLDDDTKPMSDVVFEDGTVSRHVAEALHILSLDERRVAFQPTLMNKDKRVTEIWFPGAHADVGGGFWYDGLSDLSLRFMVDELKARKLGLHLADPRRIKYEKLKAPKNEYKIDYDDVFIKPNHKGIIHTKDRWLPVALATQELRSVRVNVNDKPSRKEAPIIHHSVIDRITEVVDYRPKTLKGVPHAVHSADGVTSNHKGIVDHIS